MKDPIQITSITKLLSVLNKRKDLSDCTLFRGQEEDWELIPKIGRIDFRTSNYEEGELKMLEDFKRLSQPHLLTVPENNWDWLALAQHHGMATRLLDWTTNPLAALWFAVNKPSKKNKPGVLWLFNVKENDFLKDSDIKNDTIGSPFNQDVTKVFQPKIVTNRISAQNGWFTVGRFSKKESKIFRFDWNKRYNQLLTKFIIPSGNFSSIRYELDTLGINKMSLFPDIDGVANYCEWLNSLLSDEKK
jgi:hypothetical protein